MKIFGKPKNKWGWVRMTFIVAFAGIVIWVILAAVLRSFGEISWLMWSGYQKLTLLRGLELVIFPGTVVILAGWMEEQEHQAQIAYRAQKEKERALDQMREEKLERFRKAILAELSEVEQVFPDIPSQTRRKILEIVRVELEDLDGKGKGEALLFLFSKELIHGHAPIIDLSNLDFSGTILNNAQLNEIALPNVNLSKSNLTGSSLVKCQLHRANLEKAVLDNADMRNAALAGSNLNGAHLIDTNLEEAELRNITLHGAFLKNTNLQNCAWDEISQKDLAAQKMEARELSEGIPEVLEQAILIEAMIKEKRKVTNKNGKEYLLNKEYADLVDKL